jgi:hypothetical protein
MFELKKDLQLKRKLDNEMQNENAEFSLTKIILIYQENDVRRTCQRRKEFKHGLQLFQSCCTLSKGTFHAAITPGIRETILDNDRVILHRNDDLCWDLPLIPVRLHRPNAVRQP